MGGYHGKWSYDTFTHNKSILKKAEKLNPKRETPVDQTD